MTASQHARNILVVGATGSVGRHVVDEALAHGHDVRILVRDLARAHHGSTASLTQTTCHSPANAKGVVEDLARRARRP